MLRRALLTGILALSLAAPAAAAPADASRHLVEGARHFREGRFEAALVEFRVAERLGASPAARWYASAALVKLGRNEEAVDSFAAAMVAAPGARDGLLDYYRALACYELRLYVAANGILGGIGEVGPRVREQIAELRARIARALAAEPGRGTIDWYHARAGAARAAGRSRLAEAFAVDALALAGRRDDGYRADDARATLAALAQGGQAASAP